MESENERSAEGRRARGRPNWLRAGPVGLAIALLALALTACPGIPPPDRLDFDNDARVLRGAYVGFVDMREVPNLMEFSGDASVLAVSWPNSIELWNPETSELIKTLYLPSSDDSWPWLGGLSVDGSGSLVAGILDGKVLLWDAGSGQLLRSFDPGGRLGDCLYCGAGAISLSPSAGLLAVVGDAPVVILVDPSTGTIGDELATEGRRVEMVSFNADGTLLATASYLSDTRYALRVWDTNTYDVVFERTGTVDRRHFPRFAFSADGQRLAVSSDTRLELFDLVGGRQVLQFAESESPWFRALNADGSQVVIGKLTEQGSTLDIIEVATGATLARVKIALRAQSTWSPDGRYLLLGSQLLTADSFSAVRDYTLGQLHDLELTATALYVDTQSYDVSGSVSIDGGPASEFTGTVVGNETQRYVQPQSRAPRPAELELELHAYPWTLHARQLHRGFGTEPSHEGEWWGNMTDDSHEGTAYWYWYPFELRRAE